MRLLRFSFPWFRDANAALSHLQMKRAVEEGVVREAQAQARVLAEEARCGNASKESYVWCALLRR